MMGSLEVILSFPKIFLIPGHAMFEEQGAEFVLEGEFFVMLFLVVDVGRDRFEVGDAHGKATVSALPGKVRNRWLGFQPEGRCAFQFLDPIRLGDGATQPGKNMHMVFHAAHTKRRTFKAFGNFTEIAVQRET